MQLLSLAALGLLSLSAAANASDCERLLVPDVTLPSLDTTTDLAYLATITPGNYAAHRSNALPKLAHSGIRLPIASQLLLHARDFEDFSAQRAQQYAQHHFDYANADLATYVHSLMPAQRLDSYAACAGASGFTTRIVKVDRDFVEILASWRASEGGPAQVPVSRFATTGAMLLGNPPVMLQAQPATLLFGRELDADLHVTAQVAGAAAAAMVPRFIPAAGRDEAADRGCADGAKIVRAIFRQMLQREPKATELATQTALLSSGRNSVRQLVERVVLGDEYRKKFVRGKDIEALLEGLYQHVLARDSDEKGLASNKARFQNAAYPAIAITFFENAEYVRRFGEWSVPAAAPAAHYCATPR